MKKKVLSLLALAMFMGTAAHAQMATYQKQVIECLGVEGDGTQTVRVTGTGKNKSDAKEQARKDAVAAVIFDGIRSGTGGCDMRPLVNDMNARRKYEDYFNKFFKDGGAYEKYISNKDRKKKTDVKEKNENFTNFRLTVRVLRPKLKERLKKDGIIK